MPFLFILFGLSIRLYLAADRAFNDWADVALYTVTVMACDIVILLAAQARTHANLTSWQSSTLAEKRVFNYTLSGGAVGAITGVCIAHLGSDPNLSLIAMTGIAAGTIVGLAKVLYRDEADLRLRLEQDTFNHLAKATENRGHMARVLGCEYDIDLVPQKLRALTYGERP